MEDNREPESSSDGGNVPESTSIPSGGGEVSIEQAASSSGGGDSMEDNREAEGSSGGGNVPESTSIPSGGGEAAATSGGGGDSAPSKLTKLRDIACTIRPGSTVSVQGEISIGEGPDITRLMFGACEDLGNGDLIHGEDYKISDAMPAVEEIEHKTNLKLISMTYSVDEAIQDGDVPVPLSLDRTLDAQRLIDVMDHYLACEATWHETGNLQQTVASCFYIWERTHSSSHALLDSFCRVVRMTCDVVVSLASASDTNTEDERNEYYRLSESNEDKKSSSILEAAEKRLSDQLKACKSRSSKKKKGNVKVVEPLQTNPDLEAGLCKAVLCRLLFRKHFYNVLACMRRPRGEGLDLALKHIVSCLSELASMLKSEEFLRSSSNPCRVDKDNLGHLTTASGYQPVGFASPVNCRQDFQTTINCRFAALTRACTVKLLYWTEAVGYFEKLLDDLRFICSTALPTVTEDVLRFLTDFHKRKPGWVATSHIQLLLVQDGSLYGRVPIFTFICKSALLPESANYPVIQENTTVERLEMLLIISLRALGTNISQQRIILGKILRRWHIIHLQLHSAFTEKFGDLTRTPAVENTSNVNACKRILEWVAEQKHWIALRFLLLGFELELYSPCDYCMVYWYIYVILINIAEKIRRKTVLKNTIKIKAGQRGQSVNDQKEEIPPEMALLFPHTQLAEGLYTMLGILRNRRELFIYTSPYNTEEERFLQLFGHFIDAGYLSYSHFKFATADSNLSLNDMAKRFSDAHQSAIELRKKFKNNQDRLMELKQIQDVTVKNGLAINVLCNGDIDPSLEMALELSCHPYFAVISLKRGTE